MSLFGGITKALFGGQDTPSGPGYDVARAQATGPWWMGGGGKEAATQLQKLMEGGVSGIMSDPGFTAWNDQAMLEMQRKMQAQGMGASGNEMAALTQLGKADASQYFMQQAGLLSNLSGVGFNPAGGVQAGLGALQAEQNAYGQNFMNEMAGVGMLAGGLNAGFSSGSGASYSPGLSNIYSGIKSAFGGH